MNIRLPETERRRLSALEAEKRALLKPVKEAGRKERSASRKARSKRTGKTDAGQRQERERDNGYLAHLRRQPCCVGPLMGDACQGRTDPAHLRFTDRSVGRTNPGLSRKSDDRWCLPVCRKHHDAQHAYGNESKWWTAVVGADPNELAKQFYAAFNQEASHD